MPAWRTMNGWVPLGIAAAAVVASAAPLAAAYPERVKNACRSDFKRFCPSYKIDSTALRNCMRASESRLSNRCIDALVQTGERRSSRRR